MKRFTFRLETVLRHRETIERLREQDYVFAQGQMDKALRKLASLQEQEKQAIAMRPGSASGEKLDAPGILSREYYIQILQAQILEQVDRVETARLIAEEQRLALVAARQARQAVANLREREWTAYQVESERESQNRLDEVAAIQYSRELAEAKKRRSTV